MVKKIPAFDRLPLSVTYERLVLLMFTEVLHWILLSLIIILHASRGISSSQES